MLTPRGAVSAIFGSNSPRQQEQQQPLNLQKFQQSRFECLNQSTGTLTQDNIDIFNNIVKNAMLAGQTSARIQTLRIGKQYIYTYTSGGSSGIAYTVYDTHTKRPFEGPVRAILKLNLNSLLEWIKAQGMHFICTTSAMKNRVTMNLHHQTHALADFLHIVVVFLPPNLELREKVGPTISLWNSVYTAKCLDQSMVVRWNERLIGAIRTGATYFVVCTLYAGADYSICKEANAETIGLMCIEPRQHLTMALIDPDPGWALAQDKFKIMCNWVVQLGYAWTLLTESAECSWAYFTVLLDPLEKYE